MTRSPAPSDTPIAWMRRWAFDGKRPQKALVNGRWRWPAEMKMYPVTQHKCFDDDVPLWASLPSAERCDRGDAVNLARNALEEGTARLTVQGIRELCKAVLRMDEYIRNAAPHSVSAPTGELDVAPARGRNTAGGESSSGHAVAAPWEPSAQEMLEAEHDAHMECHEDAARYRWLRECEPDRRIEIMERAETPDLLDHHIDKGRAGW